MSRRVFYDTEFTDIAPGADLISIGLVSGDAELYIEITDCDFGNASEFVHENVLPLLGRHSPEKLTRAAAATRIQVWLNSLRHGDITKELILVSDSNWDWQMLLELYPFVPGRPTWARSQNIVGRLAQNWLASADREQGFFEALENELQNSDEQHHALVDARALSVVFMFFLQSPLLDAVVRKLTYEDDELMFTRNTLLSDGENWPEPGETQ